MSSIVMTPAVPPYSSTTITIWSWLDCISESSGMMSLVSGTKSGVRMWREIFSVPRPSSMMGEMRSLMWAMPTMRSTLPR